MARYSIELRTIKETANYNLFDFEYELYDNNLKPLFEEKFFEYFYFDEIGYPTVQRFKHMLKSKLHMIMPYYKQLYETEIASKNIDFMLNKDLKESYIRKLNGEAEGNSQATSTSDSNSNSTDLTIANDTPQNKVDDLDKYMTSAGKTNSNSSNKSSSNANNIVKNKTNNTEEYELISQGNIGITSSAELLEKWRSVLINIDEMIFKELENLFLFVY